MLSRLPIKDLKLWWPAWQIGIPINGFGHYDGKRVSGTGYIFDIEPEMDSWLCPDGKLMPMITAKLYSNGEYIDYTSCSVIGDLIQVNKYHKIGGYSIYTIKLVDAYFEGEAYAEDE